MLQPKRTKFRKAQKGRMKGISQRGHQLSNGMFGIKSLDSKFITSRQIEAARIAATRYMKRQGQLWIKIFPDKPITKKPLEVRMGKGKGAPEYWVAVVKPGRIMFEVSGVPKEVAEEALFIIDMKQSEIIELSVEDLKAKLASLKKELSDLSLGHSVSPLENPLILRSTRRTIARISTELSKRELQ